MRRRDTLEFIRSVTRFASLGEAAREHDVHLIGLSALLTTTMPNMRGVVEAVRSAGLASKVVVGGAPV